jgi:hypothetical protein
MKRKKIRRKIAGRPSLFKEEYDEQARRLCLLGLTEAELAKFFNVTTATITTWKRKHPQFLASLKLGKEIADGRVVEKLYRRAMGYSHPEEKVFCSDGMIVRAKTRHYYPPDTTACIFWLKNRRPDLWRDQQVLTGMNGASLAAPPPLVINFFNSKQQQSSDNAKLIEGQSTRR